MAKTYLGTSILDIMPESIRNDPQIRAAAKALDVELAKSATDIRETLLISRIDELPETVLDLLAWQWHVDFYEPIGLDIETKRALIKKSIAWHRIKGTPAAVEQAVAAVFGSCKVEEWYEYGGKPYSFRVKLEGAGAFDEKRTIDGLLKTINSAKNVRSWLKGLDEETGITITWEEETSILIGLATSTSSRQVAELARLPDDAASVFAGLHLSLGRHTRRIGAGARLPPDLAITSSGMYGHKSRHVKVLFNPSDMPESVKWLLLPAAALPHISSVLTDGGGRRGIYTTMPENTEDILGIGLTDILGGHALIGTGSPKPDALFGTIGSVFGHSRHITVLAETRNAAPGTYDGTPYAAHLTAGLILSNGQGSRLVSMSEESGTTATIQYSLGLLSPSRHIVILHDNAEMPSAGSETLTGRSSLGLAQMESGRRQIGTASPKEMELTGKAGLSVTLTRSSLQKLRTGTVSDPMECNLYIGSGLFSGGRHVTLFVEDGDGGLPSETCGIGSHAGLLHAGIMPTGLAVH